MVWRTTRRVLFEQIVKSGEITVGELTRQNEMGQGRFSFQAHSGIAQSRWQLAHYARASLSDRYTLIPPASQPTRRLWASRKAQIEHMFGPDNRHQRSAFGPLGRAIRKCGKCSHGPFGRRIAARYIDERFGP